MSEYPQRYVDGLNAEIASLQDQLGRAKGFESAALAAGEALDAAMKEVVTSGHLDLLNDAQLVDHMHQALNRVVAAFNGAPWREKQIAKEIAG